MSVLDAAKRAGRVTEAKLLVKRAERLCKLRPYPSEERQLIRDMRLALEALVDEVAPR
jgi:hypothetical protein